MIWTVLNPAFPFAPCWKKVDGNGEKFPITTHSPWAVGAPQKPGSEFMGGTPVGVGETGAAGRKSKEPWLISQGGWNPGDA